MPRVRGGEALTWERFQVTQDTLWENRRLTLGLSGCTASGPPKHSRYPRTSILPGDTFWLRALHKCSSLGSGTGVLQPCCKDGDFRSLNPEQMLESIQPCADVQETGRGWRPELRAVVPGQEGSSCLVGVARWDHRDNCQWMWDEARNCC